MHRRARHVASRSRVRVMGGSIGRKILFTTLSLLVYFSSEWPSGRPPRSYHAFLKGLPVLLTASIGVFNIWWPDGSTRELRELVEELRKDLRILRENRGTHYAGPAVGIPNQPPVVPPL